MSTSVAWAVRYIDLYGLALVAIPPGHKAPLHQGWNQEGGYVMDSGEARQRWSDLPDHGIGTVLGPSGLCSVDVDSPDHAEPVLDALGIDLAALQKKATPTIQGNPSRYRLMFKAPPGAALGRKALTWPARQPGEKPLTLFELRAGDIQDVLPPTVHPDTGKPYIWLTAPNSEFPILPEPLLELWQHWDSYRKELEGMCPWRKHGFNPDPAPRGDGARPNVIAAFKQARPVEGLLESYGYTRRGNRWMSPTSSSGLAGVTILDGGRVYSHHASDPLADGHAHDAFDLFRIVDHGGDARSAVKAAAEELGMGSTAGAKDEPRPGNGARPGAEGRPEPQPLPEGLPSVPELDPALLPSTLRAWVVDISERIQCPVDYPAVGAMVSLAAVVGRQIGIRPRRRDDWTVVPNLWGAIVGRPGLLKTPALAEVMKPVHRLEARARKEHEAAVLSYEAGKLVNKASAKETEKAICKALKENRRDDAGKLAADSISEEAETPARRRYVTSDTTVEALGTLLAANPRGALVYRDELVGWLRDLDREGREGSRAFYLEAWNGTGRYTYDRIGRGTLDIEAACVSILGGIQPGPLSEYLRGAIEGGVGDDGLLQRFQLIVWPDPTPDWRDVDRWPDTNARRNAWDVFERLDSIDTEALGAQREDDGIAWLRFDDAAAELFCQWRSDLEARLRTGTEHPAFEAALAKYRSLIPSIALLAHLADHPEGGPVGEPALLHALAWGAYLEAHARRLYSPALDPALQAARELARHIRVGDLPSPFQARGVYLKGWRLLDRRGVQDAIEYLADRGWLRSEEVGGAGPGRPTCRYFINPRA